MAKSTAIRLDHKHEDFGSTSVNGRTVTDRVRSGELIVGNATQTDGGIVIAHNVRKPVECLLDELMVKGDLGNRDGDEAQRRHQAGLWLRQLYLEKAQMGPGGAFRFDSSGGRSDHAESMSDAVAWNIKCFQDEMKACHPYGAMLTAICCHDDERYPRNGITKALTKLADHRGM